MHTNKSDLNFSPPLAVLGLFLLVSLTLPAQQVDWGDGPAPYPTTQMQDGARHTIRPGFHLGARVDAEPNGQPTPTAQGDDTNQTDDEDGIVFPAALTVGSSNNISVIASAPGKLDAWIDFNRDSDWADAGEQIFASQSLAAGANQLTLTIPANSTLGQTFARFRFSSVGNLAPTGSATDGEVEDYRVTLTGGVTSPMNILGGLPFTLLGSAQAGLKLPGRIEYPNLALQPNSGVAFELGQAEGFSAQVSLLEFNKGNCVQARFQGLQGDQSKDLIIVKWEGPDFDASKSEVSIETLELVHEGLSVRHFNAQGQQLSFAKVIGLDGSFRGVWESLGDTATGEVGHWMGFVSETARFVDSPAGSGLHLEFMPSGIVSPRDAASGLPTGRRVTMPDGKTIDGVTASVFSFEGLKQPVAALERAEITGIGGLKSFELSEVGLFRDGLRITGGANTRLAGILLDSGPKYQLLPEVGDEVLVLFSHAFQFEPLGLTVQFNPKEIGIDKISSSLRLSTQQKLATPVQGISSTDFWVELSTASPPTGAQLQAATPNNFLVKLGYTGPNASTKQFGVTAFNQGTEVAAFTLDGKGTDVNVEEIELVVAGPGKPTGVRPGLLRRGESFVQPGITFDAPMMIKAGDKSFVGDELSFVVSVDGELGGGIYGEISSLSLRSPAQSEFRVAPQPRFDWGDLPAPYMTTLAQNGARHRIVPWLRLGQLIDPERNGRPSPFATGDDRFLTDDEDGVTFTSALVPGANATINIAVVAPATGAFIDAFIDLFHEDENRDGDFDDPGEKILDKKPVINGVNTFTFLVPANAKIGKTYARFRLSSTGGLNSEGPANDGEIEDYIVRIASATPPTHPSGLAVVPRGGANLRTTTSGGVDFADLTDGGDDGVTLLAPSNVVSRAAGRILLPLNPPILLSAFTSVTRPFADGLVLEAHYAGTDGNTWIPQLKFMGGDPDRPVIVGAIFAGHYRDGELAGLVRISGFGANGYVGSSFADSGDVGSFSGNAKLVRLGWAAFPPSALVILDQNVTFTGVDGTELTGDRFRFLALNAAHEPQTLMAALKFSGVSIYGANPASGLLGFSDLTVRNPRPPVLNSINRLPNGTARLGFPTEPDVFYSLEATESLASPNWKPPTTAYQFGSGNASSLISDPMSGKTGFYRLRVE